MAGGMFCAVPLPAEAIVIPVVVDEVVLVPPPPIEDTSPGPTPALARIDMLWLCGDSVNVWLCCCNNWWPPADPCARPFIPHPPGVTRSVNPPGSFVSSGRR